MVRFVLCLLVVVVLAVPARGQITAAKADFDNSGVVDVADFLQFVNAFGSQTGQSGYNAKYDLDSDGSVGISDFLLFVDVFGQTVNTSEETAVEVDRAALVGLYNALGGDNWTNNTNWLSDKPIGEWYGVKTDTQGVVVELSLSENNLDGELSSWSPAAKPATKLSQPPFSRLAILNLSKNKISGRIPQRPFLNCRNLKRMELQANPLREHIPPEIGNLSNLRSLNLSNTGLSGPIPASVGDLSHVTELVIKNSQISGPIPAELGNLSILETLDLQNNQISGPIPPELGALLKLIALFLQNNQLSGFIPEEFANLTNLEKFFVEGNTDLSLPTSLQTWAESIPNSDATTLPIVTPGTYSEFSGPRSICWYNVPRETCPDHEITIDGITFIQRYVSGSGKSACDNNFPNVEFTFDITGGAYSSTEYSELVRVALGYSGELGACGGGARSRP